MTVARSQAAPPLADPGRGAGRGDHRVRLLALAAVVVLLVLISSGVGVRDIAWGTTWQALVAFDPTSGEHLLVLNQRIPRSLTAVVVGLCLGTAGAVMQALTRNPLAEPGLLGVNAGAAVAIACGIAFLNITDTLGYMWLGILGGALAGVAVYVLGGVRRGTNPVRLVLAGAALTVVLGALTQLIIINGVEEVFDRYRQWMVGSVAGRGWEVLLPVSVLAAVGLVIARALARPLDAALLGEDLSRALGSSPNRVWALAGVVVIVLAGASTAAAGPIAFLGLAAPHLARQIAGVNHRWVLPYSALLAAALILVADVLGRVIPPRGEISVGIMVALIGGPFFVHLVRRRRIFQL